MIFQSKHVISKDNIGIEINSVVYYKIVDSYKAVYGVQNLSEAIEMFTQTTLRNVIGSLDLDETLVSRDSINSKLKFILDDAADKWGVRVTRVELQDINPPKDLLDAMEKQMRAERDRRAIILEAEGKKSSAITTAEGERDSKILNARGIAEAIFIEAEAQAKAKIEIAKADAESLRLLQDLVSDEKITKFVLTKDYIKTFLNTISGKNTKTIIVPYEASSLISLLSQLKEAIKN